MKQVVLVNPYAGSGAARRTLRKIRPLLSADDTILEGNSSSETERLASCAAMDQVTRLFIVGGDGTLHHALNGFLSVPNTLTKVVVVPAGTANDYFASLLHHSRNTPTEKLTVDVGLFRYDNFQRYFFNVAGIGLTAYTALASRPSSWLPARLRYTLGLMRTLISGWRHSEVRIRLNDSDFADRNLLTLSVAIGMREGSFVLAPEARLDDGQFNLLIATGLRRRDVCCYLPGLMFGKLPAHDPRIRYLVATELELCSSKPLHVHLDGEVYGGGIVPANSQISIQHVSPIELEVLRVY